MYREHFGLEILPFKVTPDPAFLCQTSQNRVALSMLRSEMAQLYPINVVTGDVGTGKTTMILHFLRDVPETVRVGLMSNVPSWTDDILRWVLNTFEIPDASDDMARLAAFEAFVHAENAAGRKCILIVDEAQNVSEGGLEQLRRLVNVNTGKDIQFTLVLVGQNELRDKLKSSGLAALAQRVGVSVNLGPMNAEETEAYIRHRLTVAGGSPDIFDREAIAAIHEISGGYPRVVNVVCDTAMVMAYGAGDSRIGKDTIEMLGDKDSVLSHLPNIANMSRSPEKVKSPLATAARNASGFVKVEEDHLRRDVFKFVPEKPREAKPGPVAEPAPEPVVTAQEPQQEAKAEKPTVIPPGFLEPARKPAGRTGATPSHPRRGRKSRRKPEVHQSSPVQDKPDRRVGHRGLLGGAVAVSVLVAGAYVLGPLGLQDGPVTEPLDIVSVQSVSSVAPPEPDRVEQEVPETPVLLADMSGEELLERALNAGVTDPSAAAIDYARAALRGEELAAYYLGQLYETGDGVPRDLALARSWYASVEDGVRGARRRLKDLGEPDRETALAAPQPLLGGTLDTGGAEFVWTSGEGADPAFFVVELSAGPDTPLRRLLPQTTSALRVESLGDARMWRVFAVAPDMHRYAASGWTRFGVSDAVAPAGPGEVEPEAVVRLPSGTEPVWLGAVTDGLSASQIPYRVETGGAGAVGGGALQIGYFFQSDKLTAHTVADAVGAQSAVMLAEADGPDRPYPVPGQIVIYPTDR